MSGVCTIPADTGAVRAVLFSVECETRDFAHRGWEALTGGQTFQTALTAALTVYIALIGYRLLFAPDGARLSEAPRTALKIGAVLALVGSWNLFQTLVFDVAAKAPAELAAAISLRSVGGPEAMDDPVGRMQVAWDQLGASAAAFGEAGEATSRSQPAATPATPTTLTTPAASDAEAAEARRSALAASRALNVAQSLVLTVHAGLVAAGVLAVGVLGAVGPIFIVLFLFRPTRGFFVGWVRAMAAAAMVSAGTWTLILLMLRVLEPWLVTLAQQRELKALDPRTAMAAASIVEVFTAGQAGMVLLAAGVAFAFRLGSTARVAAPAQSGPAPERESGRAPAELISRAGLLADQLRRFDPVLEARGRVGEMRAAASARLAAVPQVRGADVLPPDSIYRRPAVAGGRRLRGR